MIVDTGPLVAVADTADPHHERCRALLESHPGPLVSTGLVIAEAGWLSRRQLDVHAESLLYKAIATSEILVEELIATDWARIGKLLGEYEDSRLDAADASIVAIAERFDQTQIATLNERDFRIIRPSHTSAFELLPGPI